VDATHVYCPNCRAIRPVEFERLLASEASLGTAARCARCAWVAMTMIGEARVYCDVCDEIRPAVLHEYRPAGLLAGGLVGGLLGSLVGSCIFSVIGNIPYIGVIGRILGWALIGIGIGIGVEEFLPGFRSQLHGRLEPVWPKN
jgi:hypothetical protein